MSEGILFLGRTFAWCRVETLRREAAVAGDLEMVAICDAAILGDEEAQREVARVLLEAEGEGDK
jgi:hypothetical protein